LEYSIQGDSQIVIMEYQTKKPLLYLPEGHMTHIEIENDARVSSGGEQGLSLLGWNRNASDGFIVYTPLFSMKFLELASGTVLEDASGNITEIETVEMNSNKTVSLNYNIDITKPYYVYQLNSSGRNMTNLLEIDNVVDNVITLKNNASNWVLVVYQTIGNIERLDIGKFINKGFYSMSGTTEVYNRNDSSKELLYFEFPKISIEHSFNIKILNNTDTGQVFSMRCQALVEESINKSLIRIIKRKQG